ncbi:DoxX family protein [Amycolatopsis decaplanina]|uniref:Integral membrane protein n=1 Tax=Amycolatopsis decaplanina DSM 44594 TaxID=1284240 RepID=M2Z0X5_9PSEU|nr:DoxX family protein [Amycolatopsis decaplanina]EME54244.1 integral membrane protein [Amycolatopsis decaplanina DSM 44594]
MFTAYLIVAIVTIVINAGIAAADFARAPFVLENSAAVDVPPSWIPPLASLKAAGAAGLLLGLLGVPFVGTAAAIGLVLFYFGAVLAHVRARVLYNIAFPGGFLALAVATLVLDLAQAR